MFISKKKYGCVKCKLLPVVVHQVYFLVVVVVLVVEQILVAAAVAIVVVVSVVAGSVVVVVAELKLELVAEQLNLYMIYQHVIILPYIKQEMLFIYTNLNDQHHYQNADY
jgi:hypothetical protein